MSAWEDTSLRTPVDPSTVRLLIRWIQHEAEGRYGGKGFKLEDIARELETSRHTLNRFLSKNLNHSDAEEKSQAFAKKLKHILDRSSPLPNAIRAIYFSVYEQEPGRPETFVSPNVVTHKSLASTNVERSKLFPLFGTSIIVRTANENIADPEIGEDASRPGWSMSVLYVVPQNVQDGLHHPLFKLHQKGLTGNSQNRVEGVVVEQYDRVLFEGSDTLGNRPFCAVIQLGENFVDLRNSDRKRPTILEGVMLGVSSQGATFSTVFSLFPLLTSSHTEVSAIDKTLQHAGVKDLDGIVRSLENLGISSDVTWTKERLQEFRIRARNQLVLRT